MMRYIYITIHFIVSFIALVIACCMSQKFKPFYIVVTWVKTSLTYSICYTWMEKSDYEHRAPEHEIGQCDDSEHAHSKYFIYGHCALFFFLYVTPSLSISSIMNTGL